MQEDLDLDLDFYVVVPPGSKIDHVKKWTYILYRKIKKKIAKSSHFLVLVHYMMVT
jgi:hypothetical protein